MEALFKEKSIFDHIRRAKGFFFITIASIRKNTFFSDNSANQLKLYDLTLRKIDFPG
jgi:hypothetical protein